MLRSRPSTPRGEAQLYAVLLLGETTVNDLAKVLEVTAKVVRDRISELQAYHLLATTTKSTSDTAIFAPSDLVAVSEILKPHLGSRAPAVESACARAQEQSSTDSRSIGVGIRNVSSSWSRGREAEALIIAQDLRQRFPKSGDVASVLGAALLRASPPRYKDADRELEAARRLGCTRPELLVSIIRAKTELEDWQGLYEITRSLSSNEASRDAPLDAFLRACRELVALAKIRGDHVRAADLAIEAVVKITAKILRHRLDHTLFSSLTSKRFDFAREYISALDRLNPHPGDKLGVFEGIVRLAEAEVILVDLLRIGVSGLQVWWDDVECRPVVDITACSILGRQLRRLERIESQLEGYKTASSGVIAELSKARRDLAYRGAQLCG